MIKQLKPREMFLLNNKHRLRNHSNRKPTSHLPGPHKPGHLLTHSRMDTVAMGVVMVDMVVDTEPAMEVYFHFLFL